MAAHVADEGLPGATVAVVVDGELVWTEGFGFADLENRLAARADTRFRIASISKALTAAGVGLLVQEGRLDLDAPIQRYVPGFPRKPEGVRLGRPLSVGDRLPGDLPGRPAGARSRCGLPVLHVRMDAGVSGGGGRIR